MGRFIYTGVSVINTSAFGECPNDYWDSYVEPIHRGRPKGSKNKIKKALTKLFK